MKRCPVCDKTFDDSMRFCQTDGTPLVEDAPPVDPYKTMVAGKDEIALAIPPAPSPADPFKTMVAGSPQTSEGEDEDLLQIPDAADEKVGFDQMKTMITPQNVGEQKKDKISKPVEVPKEEIKIEPIRERASPPLSPFDKAATPSQPPSSAAKEDKSDIFSSTPPEPPRFNQPSVNPPPVFPDVPPAISPAAPQSGFSSDSSFNDASSETSTNEQTMIYPSSPLPPLVNESSDPPPTVLGDMSFNKQSSEPIPSPFDAPKPSFEAPPSSPSPPFPSYQEPEQQQSPFGNQNNPFEQPSFNQGSDLNQNIQQQQQDWNPPPVPDPSWQNQNIGQNTPFQPPPPMTGGGQNQTLPIISLVLGIISLCCYIGWLTGPAALITGFLGMKNANNDPNQYGGKGLAIAGMIMGGIFTLLWIAYWIILLVFFGGSLALGSFGN